MQLRSFWFPVLSCSIYVILLILKVKINAVKTKNLPWTWLKLSMKNWTLTFKVIIYQGNTNAPYHTNIWIYLLYIYQAIISIYSIYLELCGNDMINWRKYLRSYMCLLSVCSSCVQVVFLPRKVPKHTLKWKRNMEKLLRLPKGERHPFTPKILWKRFPLSNVPAIFCCLFCF